MELGIPYDPDDWDHGLSCIECQAVFREGDRYTERLTGFAEDTPVVEIVCLDCGTARSPEQPARRA
jgi:RNase P subunit RPR2